MLRVHAFNSIYFIHGDSICVRLSRREKCFSFIAREKCLISICTVIEHRDGAVLAPDRTQTHKAFT